MSIHVASLGANAL